MKLPSVFVLMIAATMPLAVRSQVTETIDYSRVGLSSATPTMGGFTACKAELDLAFGVSGIVEHTMVEEGQVVKTGEVLMMLDQSVEEIDVQRRKVLMEDDAELRSAMARSAIAEQQMNAAKRIHDQTGGISLEEVQNRTLAYELAVIEISRLEAQKKLNELDYATARENLARRTLVAPSQGIISKIETKTGESAQLNEPVMTLCDLSQLEFVANIPVQAADTLMAGQNVKVQILSRNTHVDGRVKFVSPVVDSASGLRQVKIWIDERQDWLRPGLAANLVLDP